MKQNDAAIVRGPMLAGYFSMLFEQIVWGNLDFLIFDLPPGTGDIQLTLTQKIPLTGAVTVTTPQEIALADVRRSIAMFNKVNVDNIGIIENMSHYIDPNTKQEIELFTGGSGNRIAKEHDIPMLAKIAITPELSIACDSGNDLEEFVQLLDFKI